jgi:hypothetical protein
MKVRIKVSLSGTDFSYHAGQETDIEESVAKQWIEADYAEAITPAPSKKVKTVDTE